MVLHVLLVDDDPEALELLEQSLPQQIAGREIRWDPCSSFDDAIERVKNRRYDIVASDIYRDRAKDGEPKTPATAQPRAGEIVLQIRGERFTPVLLFTDGVFPEDYVEGPFIKLADKTAGDTDIVTKLEQLIDTGVPELAHKLHDDLDRASGSYLWTFLEDNWVALQAAGLTEPAVLERLMRRRASTQFSRLDPEGSTAAELEVVEGAEFYLHPPISDDIRLGEIMRSGDDYRVVLTPHCHLVVQPGDKSPRADYVLTVRTVVARDLFATEPVRGGTRDKKLRDLGKRLRSPAGFGRPSGRYWFLPGFLSMEHRFADFLQLESIPYARLREDYKPFAVLDVPFAEALQSCFLRFYSAVGVPALTPARFEELLMDATQEEE
jgi:CheY-like chemotaxis protein